MLGYFFFFLQNAVRMKIKKSLVKLTCAGHFQSSRTAPDTFSIEAQNFVRN